MDPQDFEMILEGEFARIDEVPNCAHVWNQGSRDLNVRSFNTKGMKHRSSRSLKSSKINASGMCWVFFV